MDIRTYMADNNLTYPQVMRRIKNGKIEAVKKGKVWEIITDAKKSTRQILEKKIEKKKEIEELEKKYSLKEALTAVQIKRIQQQLKEKQRDIELRFMEKFKEELLKALQPLPEAFRQAKLNKKQAELIQKAFNEAKKNVEHLKA